MSKPIFLIGSMGSGKTTLANYIAQHDAVYPSFIDTDSEISRQEQLSISELFEQKGEDYFRAAEHRFIHNFSSDNVVVATGGGMPCFNNTLQLLLEKGMVIYLKTNATLLAQRLWPERNTRPLLASCTSLGELENWLHELLISREKYYNQAHFILENTGDLEEMHSQIKRYYSTNPI